MEEVNDTKTCSDSSSLTSGSKRSERTGSFWNDRYLNKDWMAPVLPPDLIMHMSPAPCELNAACEPGSFGSGTPPASKALLWQVVSDLGHGSLWESDSQAPSAATSPERMTSECPALDPTLVWCQTVGTDEAASLEALVNQVGATERAPVHACETPALFARWLFAQPRGEVDPGVVLVVGWREAKPCAMAIEAARTGDTQQMRPDARRPTLPEAIGGPRPRECAVAVKTMIIKVGGRPLQRDRALHWARGEGRGMMRGVEIKVASNDSDLKNLTVSALSVARTKRGRSGSALVSL
mmetsp:Transcript_136503/g.435942  ORF Transcript_136503/g.435942 Transcript_136503/m.435942 type:complete len:295 (+) Transcript_136503:63-947(+)